MFGSNRSGFRTALDLIFAIVFLALISGLSYSLGGQNAYYTQRATNNAEHYAKDTEDRIAKECIDRETVAFAKCADEIAKATHENKRSEYDLSAQEAMADWAFWMMILSIGGFFVGAAGVVFVALTLVQTRKAVESADAAVTVTREVGRDQIRAYVYAKSAKINWTDKGVEIVLEIVNGGATPAVKFSISGVAEYLPLKTFRPIPSEMEVTTWSSLGGNSSNTAPLRQAGIFMEGLRRDQTNYLSARGTIFYTTIFGENFITQFSFMLKYRKDRLQTMQIASDKLRVFELQKST